MKIIKPGTIVQLYSGEYYVYVVDLLMATPAPGSVISGLHELLHDLGVDGRFRPKQQCPCPAPRPRPAEKRLVNYAAISKGASSCDKDRVIRAVPSSQEPTRAGSSSAEAVLPRTSQIPPSQPMAQLCHANPPNCGWIYGLKYQSGSIASI
jgi:hypothetical protein